jgi:GNAT superfamily N-acetyltransferase
MAQRRCPSVSVRVAAEADIGAVASLRRAWNEENAEGAIDDSGFERAFAEWWEAERSSRTFFVAELEGRAVGMANVKRYDRMPVAGRASGGWWGYVGNVFVLAEHRDGGIGGVLMDAIIQWAAQEGMEHLRLAPSPRSASFYERLGFSPGAVVELDPPMADYS